MNVGRQQATITSKGQMTVPKVVRDQLGIKAGDRCYVWVREGQMIVVPRNKRLADMAGILGPPPQGAGATVDALTKAARDGASEHVMRSMEHERDADRD
ncbi:AbrB/MazE/SpoVT family DNA-binding domain-containing protein [Ensifer soli]|uniref:AbrB/MazE/SpoVT family DNA-binding domain-containing protein n=1 Tax=Ciceribacter sp. sgz301302 TaxID=3342379 RepID=UPI0035BB263A